MAPRTILFGTSQTALGGAAVHALTLATGLRKRGIGAEFLVFWEGPAVAQFREAGFLCHVVPSDVRFLRRLYHIASFCRRGRFELVHVIDEPRNMALASRLVARKPTVLGVEMVRGPSERRGIRRLLYHDRFLLRFMDRVICVSRAVAERCRELGVPSRKLDVVYNGVSLERFRLPTQEERGAVRAELGIAADALVVGAVGRLNGVKCYDDLLRAVALLGDIPRLVCLLVGDGGQREILLRLRAELDLDGRAIFAGHHTDVERMLWAMDVFAMPSWSEGHPIAMIEAMATGLPVVATNIGPITETVGADGAGILVPRRDVEALSSALCHLLSDTEARRRASAAAHDRAKLFTDDVMTERTIRVYESVLGSS